MASKILQVKSSVQQNSDISSHQFHTYSSYTTTFNNNDEIRITIQNQDLNVLPCESYLFIEFTTAKVDGTAFGATEATFSYNFIAHLFSELRYELNGFEIDRCKTPGITTLLKSMIACKSADKQALNLFTAHSTDAITARTYHMVLPLRFIFGFCDDFNKIILNCKHELILVRSRTDRNMYVSQNVGDILNVTVNKIHWKVPHISLSDEAKLNMLQTISRDESLLLPFRTWDLYELPLVPQTLRHSWSVKTTSQVNKPRYVVVAFQTNRNNVVANSASDFDHCNITNVKLYLNNERYPYDDMNLNFENNNFHELFYMFQNIQQTYYNGTSVLNPIDVNSAGFLMRPIFSFDCTRADESIKIGMVDVRIEIEASQNIPNITAAYCLIIHDNLIEYSPFTNTVHRVI